MYEEEKAILEKSDLDTIRKLIQRHSDFMNAAKMCGNDQQERAEKNKLLFMRKYYRHRFGKTLFITYFDNDSTIKYELKHGCGRNGRCSIRPTLDVVANIRPDDSDSVREAKRRIVEGAARQMCTASIR